MCRPAHQEKSGVQYLARGYFQHVDGGARESNQRPSSCLATEPCFLNLCFCLLNDMPNFQLDLKKKQTNILLNFFFFQFLGSSFYVDMQCACFQHTDGYFAYPLQHISNLFFFFICPREQHHLGSINQWTICPHSTRFN